MAFSYFEVTILKKDNNKRYIDILSSFMAIGLANDNFPTNKRLGQTISSVGYSFDGKTYIKKTDLDLKIAAFK